MEVGMEKTTKILVAPDAGFTAERRADGGLQVTFENVTEQTLKRWREFAFEHLIDSTRLTRNLYDLRKVEKMPERAINYALEVNSDPSVRNIRLAVVVSNEEVKEMILEIEALTAPGGAEIKVFTDIDDAETWLSKPLTELI